MFVIFFPFGTQQKSIGRMQVTKQFWCPLISIILTKNTVRSKYFYSCSKKEKGFEQHMGRGGKHYLQFCK